MAHSNYQLLLGSDSAELRVELPEEYAAIASPTVTAIDTTNGDVLLDAATASYYVGSTLGAAATAGSSSVQLAVGATAPEPDDLLLIARSAAGPPELVRVSSYNATNRTITTTHPLVDSHSNGTAITAKFLSYDLDISDTDVFTFDKQLMFRWAPNAVDLPITQLGKIYKSRAETFNDDNFNDLYPHLASQIPDGAFEHYRELAFRRLHRFFLIRGRDVHKLVAGTDINDLLMTIIAWHIAMTRGDTWDNEAEKLGKYINEEIDNMALAEIWEDADQDGNEEPEELQTTDTLWGRSLF